MSVHHLRFYVSKSVSSFEPKKCILHLSRCYYEDKNILRLSQYGMYEDILPHQSSDKIKELLQSKPQYVYAGFDPTASSLHLGNLLVVKNLLQWQRAGHNVIALIGVATAQVGDPSGCFVDREEQNADVVKERGYQIQKNIQAVFDNHEKYFWSRVKDAGPLTPVKFVNNEEWFNTISAIDFLNNTGRHFKMGNMLLKGSVKKRIDSPQGMSCAEFLYQIIQAYDWYYLYKTYGCKFQIGGIDQTTNIEAGNELIRSLLSTPSYGLTLPLLTNRAGKLGKTEQNAIWLDPVLTTPYDFYQAFIRLPDSQATKLLKLFSFKPYQDVESIVNEHLKAPHHRLAHTVLAEEVTLLAHGEEGLESAKLTTQFLFSNDIEALSRLNADNLAKALPGCTIVERPFETGCTVLSLVLDIRCFFYEVHALDAINKGGVFINLKKVTNVDEVISKSDHVLPNNTTVIRVGKKRYYIIKWISS